MMGPSIEDHEMAGIVPRVCDHIFTYAAQADESIEFTVQVSFVEIYLERIRDLLDSSKDNLQVGEDPAQGGVYIKGVTEVYATSVEEMMAIMEQGNGTRAVAATGMNEGSSRSHSIFIVALTQKDTKAGVTKTGRLYLCDLAGSETINKTGATGQRLKEATKINQSLSALGNVINALTDGRSKHIPYRDSKLTRVLQESIGGNSRTSLIINASPAAYNEQETLSTLRFGKRAKTIKNKATMNKRRTPEEMERHIRQLEAQLEQLKAREEHWIAAVTGQADALHDDCKAVLAAAGGSVDIAVSADLAADAASTARDPSSRASSAGAGGGADDSSDAPDGARLAELQGKVDVLSGLLTEAGQELQGGRQRLEAADKRAAAAEADAKAAAEQASALTARLAAQEEALVAAQSAEAGAAGDLEAARTALADHKAQLAAAESTAAALEEQVSSLKADKEALAGEKAALEKQHNSLVADQVARIEARVAARKEAGAAATAGGGKQRGLRRTSSAESGASAASGSDGADADADGETPGALRRALAEARAEAEDLAATVKSNVERSDELSTRVGVLDEELSGAKASLAVLTAAKAGAEATVGALREDIETLQGTYAKARAENAALRESVAELRTTLAHVEETVHVSRERELLSKAAAAVADGRVALAGGSALPSDVAVPAAPVAGDVSQRELASEHEDAFEVQTVLESVWENERHFSLGWARDMLPVDPPVWCRAAEEEASEGSASPAQGGVPPALWGAECPREAVALPQDGADGMSAASSGWYWLGPWRVDMDGATDDQGWQYAGDFEDLYRDAGLSGKRSQGDVAREMGSTSADLAAWRGTRSPEDAVRRRRWVRERVQLVLDAPHAPGLGQVAEYLLQATAVATGEEAQGAAAAARARRLVQEFESKTARQLLLMQARLGDSAGAVAALSGELRRKNIMVQQYERRIGEILQKMADAASTGNLSHIGATSQPVRVLRGGGGKTAAQPVRTVQGGAGSAGGVRGFFKSFFASPTAPEARQRVPAGATPPRTPTAGVSAAEPPLTPGTPGGDSTGRRSSGWLSWSGLGSGSKDPRDGAAASAVSDTRLLEAAAKGDVQLLQTVLAEAPELLDGADSQGRTAVICAARAGHVEAMRALHGAGASLHGADSQGRTAMQFAARKGHLAAVEWLLQKGLSVNDADAHALSPLHQATLGRSADACKLLVERGARLDARDTNGRTPLALAQRFSAGATSDSEKQAWAAVIAVLGNATQRPRPSPLSPDREEVRAAETATAE